MNLRFVITVLYCFNSILAFSQSREVSINVLEFNNEFEKRGFEAMENGDTNHLHILLAASQRMDSVKYESYKSDLEAVFESLDSASLVKKKPKKIIKTVFNSVHNGLLVKYEEQNQFCEVFETGFYNCVSASALYSYMLGRLGILQNIVETPNHVFVIAYPQDETWVLESTNPQQGFFQVKEKDREEYIQTLLDQKLITQEQLDSEKRDSILSSLSSEEAISGNRLVAIQYLNQAVYDLEGKRLWDATQNILKSMYISPGKDDDPNVLILLEWLDKEDYSKPQFFDILEISWGLMAEEDKQDNREAINYYGSQFEKGLMKREVFLKWADFFMLAYEEDSANLKFVEQQRELFLAVDDLQHGQFTNAFGHSKSALAINDTIFQAQRLFLVCLGALASNKIWSDKMVEDSIPVFSKEYPALMTYPLWKNMVYELQINRILSAVEENKYTNAIKLLDEFEEQFDGEVPEALNRDGLARAYGKVAHHVYQKSKKKALQLVERGLKFAPNDELLNNLKNYYQKN